MSERAGETFAYAKVIKSDGVVMANMGEAAHAAELDATAQTVIETAEPWFSADGFEMVVPITSKKGKMRGALVMIWSPDPVLKALREGLIRDYALGAGLLVASALLCFLLLRRMLGRPLDELSGALERIDGGDYSRHLAAASRADELGSIARRIEALQVTLAAGRDASEARAAEQEEQARAVDGLREGLAALARRDLAFRMNEPMAETYEPLRADFNTALESIAAMMAQVLQTASGILAQTGSIEHGSGDLSGRIQTQTETLESISGALNDLNQSVADAAGGALEVNGIVGQAVQEAQSSGKVVENAVAAMIEIEQSATQIGTIIGVIDDIAFQTNLLALNAAVEAARAGSAGAGFAVVAGEVRSLAQRSSDAATEIKELITRATNHIENGVSEVNNTGEVLNQIIGRMGEISERVAGSAQGFSRDSEQLQNLAQNLNELGVTTNENTEIVAGTVQSVGRLRGDAGTLDSLVGQFNLPPRQGGGPSSLRVVA